MYRYARWDVTVDKKARSDDMTREKEDSIHVYACGRFFDDILDE